MDVYFRIKETRLMEWEEYRREGSLGLRINEISGGDRREEERQRQRRGQGPELRRPTRCFQPLSNY